MTELNLNFGVLLEITEDWIRNSQIGNRIIARIIDGDKVFDIAVGGAYFVENLETIYLVTKSRNQQDILDDQGKVLNDETPQGIYRDWESVERDGLDYGTPLEIEIWFTDEEDEIQFRLECHKYHIDKDCLILIHSLGSEDDELKEEFRHMLHQQY